MEWVEVLLGAGPLADEIAALLPELAPLAARGVEVRDDTVVCWAPAAEADAARLEIRAAAERLAAAGLPVDPDSVRLRPAPPEAEWRDAWKRFFRTTRLGRRIVIVPSWERDGFTAAAGDVVLELDPGRAFGTGAHASTRLCLGELERLCDHDRLAPARFLDVGTGSGILSIAAAKLWPRAAGVALDIDPIAVGAARENLARNGVADRVRVDEGSVADVAGRFALIVANIQADVLEAMRDALAERLLPGGALLLSGLLAPQAEPVAAGYRAAGLRLQRRAELPEDPEWSAVLLRSPP
jgi:ribosomal protein L11 methyltransferase